MVRKTKISLLMSDSSILEHLTLEYKYYLSEGYSRTEALNTLGFYYPDIGRKTINAGIKQHLTREQKISDSSFNNLIEDPLVYNLLDNKIDCYEFPTTSKSLVELSKTAYRFHLKGFDSDGIRNNLARRFAKVRYSLGNLFKIRNSLLECDLPDSLLGSFIDLGRQELAEERLFYLNLEKNRSRDLQDESEESIKKQKSLIQQVLSYFF